MSSLTEHIANVNHLHPQSTNMTEVKEALNFISPDISRDDWVLVGMALKSEFGDEGYVIFEFWSSLSDKFNQTDCESTWRSINGTGGVGIGTLFMMAKEGGFTPVKNGCHKPYKAARNAPKPPPIDRPKDLTKSREIAQKYWDESVPGEAHPYADKKGFPNHGLRVHGDQLCVPAYDAGGHFQSVLRIPPDGKQKKNLYGTRIKGAYHPIRGDKGTIVICEGWVTGKSINAATGYSVAVAFGKGGLKDIAHIMADKLPDAR